MMRLARVVLTLLVCLSIHTWASAISASEVLEAIKTVESHGNPFAIRDNTGDRSYYPKSLVDAVAKAKELLALGHNIDMGLYQINSYHLKGGLSADNIFNPSTQATAAAQIFDDFYTRAKAIYGDTELAIWRATGAYNAGNAALYRDNVTYVSKVLAVLGLSPDSGNRGGWSQANAAPRPLRTEATKFTDIVTPSQWSIGTEIEDADHESSDAGERPRKIAAIVMLIIVIVVTVIIIKLGILWWAVKWLFKKAIAIAARQMTKQRTLSI